MATQSTRGPCQIQILTSFWGFFWKRIVFGELGDSKQENKMKMKTKNAKWENGKCKQKDHNENGKCKLKKTPEWTKSAMMMMRVICDANGGHLRRRGSPFLYIKTPDRPPLRLLLVCVLVHIFGYT